MVLAGNLVALNASHERSQNVRGKLTPKQARFVEEYLIDLNATQAAIRAGFSARNASRIASELIDKTHVKAESSKRNASARMRLALMPPGS